MNRRAAIPLALIVPLAASADTPCGIHDSSEADAGLYGDEAGDRAGWAVSSAGDVDDDGRPDVLVGGPGSGDTEAARSGAAWLVTEPSGAVQLSNQPGSEGEIAGGELGAAVCGPGDLDGDGWADLVVAAPNARVTADEAGIVYVIAAFADEDDLPEPIGRIVGEHAAHFAGWSLAGVGDLDRDGNADLLVGAPGDTIAGADAGAAYLFAGPIVGYHEIRDADAALIGEAAGDRAGWSVASAGDVDEDGVPDVLVGAPYAGDGGAVYLLEGPLGGVVSLASADAKLAGTADARWGWSVAGVGDVDGDGWTDVLVGAPGDDAAGTDAGAAYLFRGPIAGTLRAADAAAVLRGAAPGDQAGWSVAAAGDVNGDGRADLLVGAPHATVDGVDGGAAYLVLGPIAGAVSLSSADGVYGATRAGAAFGWSVAGPGDVDEDGFDDVLIGAYADASSGEATGAAFLFDGGACEGAEDADRDGWPDEEDCDDADGSVHPDADEDPCNGLDDDCDEDVDEGEPPTWYADEDEDGWGDEPLQACEAPEGAVALPGDCDDEDPAVNPDADEVCNGVDDDCDGDDDEGCDPDDTDAPDDTDDTDDTGVPLRSECGCERRGTGGTWTALALLLGVPWRRRVARPDRHD